MNWDDIMFCRCHKETNGTITELKREKDTLLGAFDKFPLINGNHTSFMMLLCGRCQNYLGFPDYNFKLALDNGTKDGLTQILKVVIKTEKAKDERKD